MITQDQQLKTRTAELEKELAEKTAELGRKNRELQIESSLEKVREIALSMKKPDDMLEICKTISAQLESLGVKEIRNVQTAIFHEEKGFYYNYEYYAKHDKTVFTETGYKNHPLHNEFAGQMLKGAGEVFIRTISKKELPDWIRYQKTTNVFIDTFLETAPSLTYYWHSLGPVALGMSTYVELSDTEIDLFKRFKNVFELSYRRYLDIEKAEAQAHEAQIELALERVRARTMSMQKSEELSETAQVLFQQFNDLGAAPIQITIGIFNEEENVIEFRSTDPFGTGARVDNAVKGSLEEPTLLKKIYTDWKEGKKSTVIALEGKELSEWVKYRINISGVSDDRDYSDKRRAVYVGFFSKGMLSVSAVDDPSRENIQLLERFAGVFDLTYTRFLDLKQAEAQAREAQIQLALERVRAKAMSMQKSEDLGDAIAIVFEQLDKLDIETLRCGISIINKENRTTNVWSTAKTGASKIVQVSGDESMDIHPLLQGAFAAWLEQKDFSYMLEGEDLKKFYTALAATNIKLPDSPAEIQAEAKQQYLYVAHFTVGGLYAFKETEFSEEEKSIIRRFGDVFNLTYTRFNDLKQAEAQTREAQIEAALEKVRGRAMAMHNSSDLSATSSIVFSELRKLGINSIRSGVGLLSKNSPSGLLYAATSSSQSNELALVGSLDMSLNQCLVMQYESWLKNENYFPVLSGDELKSYYETLSKRFSAPPLTEEQLKHEQYGYYFPFSEGIFYAWTDQPYSENEINILNRFKAIVDLTFRRYLDLQKAEAQTREAQIETSLERVRSSAMAMHHSGDLSVTVNIIFRELKNLGIVPVRCGVTLINGKEQSALVTLTTASHQGESYEAIGNLILRGSATKEENFRHWQLQQEFFPVLSGKELKEYYKAMEPQIVLPDLPPDAVQYGSFLYFKEGGLFTWTERKISEEELQILRKFTSVISLTYRRYLDLKEAEAQAREAQIEAGLERVRSRTLAMHSSDELAETAAVLFRQVISLGIEPNRLYIAIIKDESGDTEFWITDEDGSKVSTGFSTNLNDNRTFKKMFAGWKEQKKSIVIDMEGKELQEYFRQLSELNVPFKGGLSQKRRVQNIAYFSQGFIGIASPDSQPEETEKLLERFASVFNLTYTRFNDLQVAEAHAIQSQIEEQKLREEKKRSDALLLNILPEEIANELKQFGKSYARKHDEVTVLFADIKGFSTIAENLSASELVNQLDECFRAFDHIVDKHGLEKIKTVGDAYVCACGLPKPVIDNAAKAVAAALDMMNFIKGFAITKTIQDLPAFEFRIGIHTGPVITGVVGLKKFTYDIWGDAVNMAARMEQHGEPGKINISGSTYALIKDKFSCTPRGKIPAKNKGEVDMYFVEGSTAT